MDFYGLVSVIVPIYNVEKYLKRCVDALLHQTYPWLEIILVDDGSPDNCAGICDDYGVSDQRIKVIHKQNAGLGMARNSGLEIATGEYVIFVDSDDYVEPTHVESLLAAMVAERADMVSCGYVRRWTDGKTVSRPVTEQKRVLKNEEVIQEVFLPMLGAQPNAAQDVERGMSVWLNLYRRERIREFNICFVSEREYVSEDLFFNMNYILHSKTVVLIPQCNYIYSENETSLTNTYRGDRFEKYCKLLEYQIEILKANELLDVARLRIYRTFIMKTQKSISMIASSSLSWPQMRNECKKILNSRVLQEILEEYMPHVKSKKQKIRLYILKSKMSFVILMLYRMKNKMN